MRWILAVLAATALGLAGCDEAKDLATEVDENRTAEAGDAQLREEIEQALRDPDPGYDLEPARCPSGAGNCASASGAILYVERVDPDGDGDAHFVLLSEESITGPYLTVVDVRPELRPHPLPGRGTLVSAAGPVYEGSYGQRQIQADVFNVER